MRAHLVLKPAHDSTRTASAFPTAATIRERMASPDAVLRAAGMAEVLGFEVVGSSPLQITIEGPKSLFEEVFSAKLKRVAGQRKGNTGRKVKAAAESVVAHSPSYDWGDAPQLPEEMSDVVSEIVLPRDIAMHG